jgi:hypothetical protein
MPVRMHLCHREKVRSRWPVSRRCVALAHVSFPIGSPDQAEGAIVFGPLQPTIRALVHLQRRGRSGTKKIFDGCHEHLRASSLVLRISINLALSTIRVAVKRSEVTYISDARRGKSNDYPRCYYTSLMECS